MRSRAVRATLTLLAAGALLTAAYLCWTIQSRIDADVQSAADFDQARSTAVREAYELRSAQQAYVAAGQNETFWFGRVTNAAESLRASLATLKSSTTSEPVAASLDEAGAALLTFEQVDRRARNYASGGQRLLASDVIFSDGLEATGEIILALDQAGAAVDSSVGAAAAAATREQAVKAAGAAAFALLALLLLLPVAAAPAVAAPVIPGANDAARKQAHALDEENGLGLSPRPEPETRAKAPGKPSPIGVPVATPSPPPPFDIERVASVCTDLAKLSDTTLLPGILARAAAALDASGLVLWMADADGQELVPVAAHGYPPSVVSRMGSLKAADENATAAAFRTCLLQTVKAGAGATGAVAVPLVTPSGCRGVLSAEVRQDEMQPARVAAAAILAAQLATLVGPPAAQSEDRTTAAL